MANEVIDSLFVRLGLETDQQQFEQAESQFSSLQSTVLQFGAIIGGGIGLQDLTFGFSESVDEMNKFAEVMEGLGVTPQFVNQMRGAFELIRGDAEEAIPFIQNIADLIEDTDWGEINESALARGLDLSGLQDADSIAGAMAELNAQMREMEDPERARRLANALGFSDDQFRLLRNNDIGQLREESRQLNPMTAEMSDAAREFNQGWNGLSMAMTGLKNEISESFVGDLGQGMQDVANAIAENRGAIVSFWDEAKPILTGMAASLTIMATLRAARAGLGILSKIPGLTLAAGAIGGAIYGADSDRDDQPSAEERVRRQRTDLELMQDMPESVRDQGMQAQREWMQDMRNLGQVDRDLQRGDLNYEINIDARGARDPAETRRQLEGWTLELLEEAADNAREDTATEAQ